MQVTCPSCRARYAVDPLAIGPSGRTVQCARCNERWFQTVKVEPPPAAPPAAEPEAKPSVRPRLMPWFASKPAPGKTEPDDEPDEDDQDDDLGRGAAAPPKVAAKAEPARPRFLRWLPFGRGAKKAAAKPKRDREPKALPKPGEASKSAARVIDTAPVPDVVIRPPTRGASLPALIEPRVERQLSLALVGTLMLLLLLAAGILAFHNVIADQL